MELSQRQKKILRAIVECYINTAEPVGSKTIAAMEGMDFSSATILNYNFHPMGPIFSIRETYTILTSFPPDRFQTSPNN